MNRLELVNIIKDLGADLMANAETYVPEDVSNITSLYFDCDTNVTDEEMPKINVHIEKIPERFLERHKGISGSGTCIVGEFKNAIMKKGDCNE